jgi:hypothetical protein
MFNANVALGAIAADIAEKNMTTGEPETSVFCAKMGPKPWAFPTAHPTKSGNEGPKPRIWKTYRERIQKWARKSIT